MDSLFIATGLVALAETGDKTQLLALLLAVRYRQPVPIVLGILVATLANHGLAAGFGAWLTNLLAPDVLRWLIGLSFLAMAVWVLIPDELADDSSPATGISVFGATTAAFFLAEMGDKTQVATVALAAGYGSVLAVVVGTTLGMLIANVPVVYLGERCTRRIPMGAVRLAAALFAACLGVGLLIGFGGELQAAP